MSELTPAIFCFCALPCEARPLIKAWRMHKLAGSHPFAIYTGADRVLVTTGLGKISMAGAMGYALALFAPPEPVLLNLGIAGHPTAALGTMGLADKIVDQDNGKCFYPQMPFTVPCATYPLMTRSKPETTYAVECLYDMEASAFYELAVKFSSSELIHVVKVVSDNLQSPVAGINEDRVEAWITAQLAGLETLLVNLKALRQSSAKAPSLPVYAQLLERHHFSVTHAMKLKNLLQRWQVLYPDRPLNWPEADIKNAKELLAWLETQLAEAVFYLE